MQTPHYLKAVSYTHLLRFNGTEQREKGTSITFETDAPVKLLVAYFKDDQKKYAKAPKLEIDASANDYGQAEPVLTNAVRINGMPLANVHAYSFPAGKMCIRDRYADSSTSYSYRWR